MKDVGNYVAIFTITPNMMLLIRLMIIIPIKMILLTIVAYQMVE